MSDHKHKWVAGTGRCSVCGRHSDAIAQEKTGSKLLLDRYAKTEKRKQDIDEERSLQKLESEHHSLKAHYAHVCRFNDVLRRALQRVTEQDRTRGYPTGQEWMFLVAHAKNAMQGLEEEDE